MSSRKQIGPLALAHAAPQTRREVSEGEYVQALERGFAVIKSFTGSTPSMSIAEVAQRTGLTRATARRYLLTLAKLACTQQERDGRFTLTPKVLDLGFAYLSTMTVANVAQPFMEQVVAQLQESCSVSVLDGRHIVYVARMPAKRIMSVNLVVGSHLPAHATSMGKVLLAHLPPHELSAFFASGPLEPLTKKTICSEPALRSALSEVRQRGWASADQESEEGVRSVAAPLWDRNRHVKAAINVSAHASRVSLSELRRRHLPVLLDAARSISRVLGNSM